MKELVLTKGKVALIDDEDFEYLSQWKWSFDGRYAVRGQKINGKRKTIRLHSFLMQTPIGMDTDHINGDKLDNRKSNLRICTKSENMFNRKIQKNNKSGHVGVFFNKKHKKWQSTIKKNGKNIYLGLFYDFGDAVEAYKNKARELFIECSNKRLGE